MFILGKLLDIVREKGVVGYPSEYGSTSPVGGSTFEENSNCLPF